MDKCCDKCHHLLTTELCVGCNGHSSVCSNVYQEPPTLYTIKPLEWEEQSNGKGVMAHTPIGISYFVGVCKTNGFRWDYVPDYDEECAAESCDSIEDGKAQAEAHYREQIGKCLEVYNGSKNNS